MNYISNTMPELKKSIGYKKPCTPSKRNVCRTATFPEKQYDVASTLLGELLF